MFVGEAARDDPAVGIAIEWLALHVETLDELGQPLCGGAAAVPGPAIGPGAMLADLWCVHAMQSDGDRAEGETVPIDDFRTPGDRGR